MLQCVRIFGGSSNRAALQSASHLGVWRWRFRHGDHGRLRCRIFHSSPELANLQTVLLLAVALTAQSTALSLGSCGTDRPAMANTEQTFIMIKPDGVARGLVGEIIKRFEQKVT